MNTNRRKYHQNDRCNRPVAANGWLSYRYAGNYGWIMIGASDDADALIQAQRSLSAGKAEMAKLERWAGDCYVRVMP